MNYKIIASDLDGTLLTKDKKVSERNREAVKKMSDAGFIFAIATGRGMMTTTSIRDSLDISVPIIACNGANIEVPKLGKNIDTPLSRDIILNISEIADSYNIYYHYYGKEKIYTNRDIVKDNPYFYANRKNWGSAAYMPSVKYESVEEVIGESEDFYKTIFASADSEVLERLASDLEELGTLAVTSSSPFNVEVTLKDVNKGNALKQLIELYGIEKEQVIAIGDSMNDYSMLEFAKLGVAVSNASDIIKEVSDLVTVSNEEDAISEIIYKYILK